MPIIFEPTAALLAAQSTGSLGSPSDGSGVAPNGGSQIWIAASPSNASPVWGGCQVWLSFDNTTYTQIGTIASRANQGVLTASLAAPPGANPDTTDTLGVDLSMSGGALATGSDADAQAGRTLCYVDGELIAYGLATPTTGDAYNLTDLYRGLYGTTGASHANGAAFALLDDNIFRYNLPTTYAGQTLYFKFASFNSTGGGVQDLSLLTAVSYTPSAGIVPTGTITSGDATVSTSGAITLVTTGVTAGSYTYGSFTADAKGRLTAASSGAMPLLPANNLSDVANAATARGNLAAAKSGANSDITSLTGLTTALAVSQGGTGQASFADGQLLIGDSSTNGLDKASLSAGSNISITNGHGTISIAATVPASANPTGSVGLSAITGSSASFLRADGAPALSQAITPTWTGAHTFNKTITASNGSAGAPSYIFGGTTLALATPGFWNDGTGDLLIGFDPVQGDQFAFTVTSGGVSELTFSGYGGGTRFRGETSLGNASSPAPVSNGTNLFGLFALGYDGSAFTNGAALDFLVNGSVSSGIVPGSVRFRTANASGALTEAMLIDSSQNIFVGSSGATKIVDSSGNLYDTNLAASSPVYSDGGSPPKLTTTAPTGQGMGTIGTWTPADASGAGLAFTNVTAKYQQIGNLVFAYAAFAYPATASTLSAKISGLPVAVPNRTYAQNNTLANTGAGSVSVIAVPNSSTAVFTAISGGAPVLNSTLSGDVVSLMLIYPAA